jgi:hypothetical protein
VKKIIHIFSVALLLVGISVQAQLRPIEIKGKFGYINEQGELAIPAQYDLAMPFSNGHAVVAINLQPCLINQNGDRVIDTGYYRQIGTYSDGLCFVETYKRQKMYIDINNTPVVELEPEVYEARPFVDGIAVISVQAMQIDKKFGRDISTVIYLFGYIDQTGKRLTQLVYDDCSDFDQGYSVAIKKGKFGMFDKNFNEVMPFRYTQLSGIRQNKLIVNDNGKFGIYDMQAGWIVKPKYRLILDYNDGMAGFMDSKGKLGYLDAQGKISIKPQYEDIRPFSEGIAAVYISGKWGFVNKQNQVVIRPIFDNAAYFSDGLCPVQVKRKWGYVNEQGRIAIPADYDITGQFYKGIAPVVYKDVAVYVNKRGQIVPKLHK